MKNAKEKQTQLIDDGFCVFEQVLDEGMLTRVSAASDRLLEAQSAEHFEQQKSTGSLISVWDDPFFAELVAYPPTLETLTALGYPRPRWSTGRVISKPPGSPPLFWHQDWTFWDDPVSYTDVPQNLFLMYYLVDTNPHNGCLRVIKGSHRKRHPLHDALPEAHADTLSRATNPDHPAYQPVAEDMAVPVTAGDLVIGDSRLLHGAYGNQSDQWRTLIILWYHPDYDASPERIRAYLPQRVEDEMRAAAWPAPAQKLVQSLLPTYDGDVEPLAWNRTLGEGLT
ncbi:phytanoyl-CoA dioxygenase family protein [Chloroflexi bacterium TSY]|nr:phytanoyl-CoA dioxygenase family protein [Chloroflexi bacterium TSY]